MSKYLILYLFLPSYMNFSVLEGLQCRKDCSEIYPEEARGGQGFLSLERPGRPTNLGSSSVVTNIRCLPRRSAEV